MKRAIIAVALLLAVAGAHAQETAAVTIQFDNRGNKVMSSSTEKRITAALAKHVFMVPAGNVVRTTGIGQSGLTNHQSVVTYTATGPTTNGKTVLQNCQANTKGGIFSSSTAAKELKKATDTWAIGDSVKVQSAKCGAVKGSGVATASPVRPTGRKMVL